MLGNWMIQNGLRMAEAKEHFDVAVASGRERSFVRQLQLGGMIYADNIQTRIELTRVANEMRKNGEKIGESNSSRIISTNYSTVVVDDVDLVRILAALPPDEGWGSYFWVGGTSGSKREDDSCESLE